MRRGVPTARLDCMEENADLVGYYQRQGFDLVGRAREPYPHRGRLAWAVLMEKPLTSPTDPGEKVETPGDGSPTLGLSRGTVEVHPYSFSWPELFRRERDLLAEVMGPVCLEVEHVGSTAVPGLSAKPVIDIQVAVRQIPGLQASTVLALEQLGYQVMPERAYPTRLFMPKGPEGRRTHHLNLVVSEREDWLAPLRFRDALRADEALRDEYAELKRSLTARYSADRDTYTAQKSEFIRRAAIGR